MNVRSGRRRRRRRRQQLKMIGKMKANFVQKGIGIKEFFKCKLFFLLKEL